MWRIKELHVVYFIKRAEINTETKNTFNSFFILLMSKNSLKWNVGTNWSHWREKGIWDIYALTQRFSPSPAHCFSQVVELSRFIANIVLILHNLLKQHCCLWQENITINITAKQTFPHQESKEGLIKAVACIIQVSPRVSLNTSLRASSTVISLKLVHAEVFGGTPGGTWFLKRSSLRNITRGKCMVSFYSLFLCEFWLVVTCKVCVCILNQSQENAAVGLVIEKHVICYWTVTGSNHDYVNYLKLNYIRNILISPLV